jgi:hypothetical protein
LYSWFCLFWPAGLGWFDGVPPTAFMPIGGNVLAGRPAIFNFSLRQAGN